MGPPPIGDLRHCGALLTEGSSGRNRFLAKADFVRDHGLNAAAAEASESVQPPGLALYRPAWIGHRRAQSSENLGLISNRAHRRRGTLPAARKALYRKSSSIRMLLPP